jgi:hypothetical protein
MKFSISGYSGFEQLIEGCPGIVLRTSTVRTASTSARCVIALVRGIKLKQVAKIRAIFLANSVLDPFGAVVPGTGSIKPAVHARPDIGIARHTDGVARKRRRIGYRFTAFPAHTCILPHLTKNTQ